MNPPAYDHQFYSIFSVNLLRRGSPRYPKKPWHEALGASAESFNKRAEDLDQEVLNVRYCNDPDPRKLKLESFSVKTMQTSELRQLPDRSNLEPSEKFEYPEDSMPDQVKEWFKNRYGGDISQRDAEWLAEAFDDFLVNTRGRMIPKHQARAAALRMGEILFQIDLLMNEARDYERVWKSIALALALPSVCFNRISQTQLAKEHVGNQEKPLSKMAVSRTVAKLCWACHLDAAFGKGPHPLFQNLEDWNL